MLVLSEICFKRMAMGEEISLLRLELFSNGLIETADPGWRIFNHSGFLKTSIAKEEMRFFKGVAIRCLEQKKTFHRNFFVLRDGNDSFILGSLHGGFL
ncbi:hypothetical protein BSM4216_3258 [Bacillus smithii]|nr:hypothetical protein BSM4216_3258 [Bacillus smithii]